MSAYARKYLSDLRENPYKKQLLNTLMFLTVGALTITVGAFLVDDQNSLKTADPSKTSDFKYWTGVITIILGCLIVLYLIYSFFAA
jgi:uncharacterized BrkB/YihY/UPF0761 family membrane protein